MSNSFSAGNVRSAATSSHTKGGVELITSTTFSRLSPVVFHPPLQWELVSRSLSSEPNCRLYASYGEPGVSKHLTSYTGVSSVFHYCIQYFSTRP